MKSKRLTLGVKEVRRRNIFLEIPANLDADFRLTCGRHRGTSSTTLTGQLEKLNFQSSKDREILANFEKN